MFCAAYSILPYPDQEMLSPIDQLSEGWIFKTLENMHRVGPKNPKTRLESASLQCQMCSA